jgi:hypothetical protein
MSSQALQQQPQIVQQGGVVDSIHMMMSRLDSPAMLIYGFLLVLVIVYSPVIPTEARVFADSFLGRVFGVAIVYGITETLGWVYGLLTALAFLLILNGAPRYGNPLMEGFREENMQPYSQKDEAKAKVAGKVSGKVTESFTGGGSISSKNVITHHRRWFVEEVLGECPTAIESDRVTTQAVQD